MIFKASYFLEIAFPTGEADPKPRRLLAGNYSDNIRREAPVGTGGGASPTRRRTRERAAASGGRMMAKAEKRSEKT